MKTRTDYHRKNFGNVQISKRIMSQKLFKFFYKKQKLKKKRYFNREVYSVLSNTLFSKKCLMALSKRTISLSLRLRILIKT